MDNDNHILAVYHVVETTDIPASFNRQNHRRMCWICSDGSGIDSNGCYRGRSHRNPSHDIRYSTPDTKRLLTPTFDSLSRSSGSPNNRSLQEYYSVVIR